MSVSLEEPEPAKACSTWRARILVGAPSVAPSKSATSQNQGALDSAAQQGSFCDFSLERHISSDHLFRRLIDWSTC
jgi:hypothetical protein